MSYTEFYDLIHQTMIENEFQTTWSLDETPTDFSIRRYPCAMTVEYKGKTVDLEPNPTLLEVWRSIDIVIRLADDLQHSFIEQIKVNGTRLEIVTGS